MSSPSSNPATLTPSRHRLSRQLALLVVVLLACTLNLCAQSASPAQPSQPTQAQAELYERWRANVREHQRTAYEAGKEYLAKYPDDEYATYVRPWVEAYERAVRKARFQQLLYRDKKYGEAYAVGRQVLADEPDNVKTVIDLASAAYLAAGANDEAIKADALALARKAIGLLEANPKVADWQPFRNSADALGYLNFVIGDLILKDAPADAITYLRKAALSESAVKQTPDVYARLAAAYAKSQYEPLANDYAARYAGKEATPESQAALAKIYPVLDRIIDAYARAVALSRDEPQYNATRARWLQELTELYKSRHDNSTDGLNDLITNVINKPLPEAATP
ncbi:MAG TPA: hypothetical protein VE821_08280 [Pyrinomonadaceae bacterium]|nr:hypothetical protein [Pyrinomonadaceae bacterium]